MEAMQLEHVSKTFGSGVGEVQALKDVNFVARREN